MLRIVGVAQGYPGNPIILQILILTSEMSTGVYAKSLHASSWKTRNLEGNSTEILRTAEQREYGENVQAREVCYSLL
jgi:hypothetical protein